MRNDPNQARSVLTDFLSQARAEVDRIDADYKYVRSYVRNSPRPTADSLHHLLDLEQQRRVAVASFKAGNAIARLLGVAPDALDPGP